MTITVTDKCYYPGKRIANITGAKVESIIDDDSCMMLYAESEEGSRQICDAIGMDGYVTLDDKPEIYEMFIGVIGNHIWSLAQVSAEPKYDRMTQYVIDRVGSVEKIGDFRFWMPVELYSDMQFFSVSTGEYRLAECRISTDEEDEYHLLGQSRYDHKCRVVPVCGSRTSSRLMYADDLYSYFEDGTALPIEAGDKLEYVDVEKPLAGGFSEKINGYVVRNSAGEIRLSI